jgi:hypothetical protein
MSYPFPHVRMQELMHVQMTICLHRDGEGVTHYALISTLEVWEAG